MMLSQRLEETLWDDLVEWTEKLQEFSVTLDDCDKQLLDMSLYSVSLKELTTYREQYEENMTYLPVLSEEVSKYSKVISPFLGEVSLKPGVSVRPGKKKLTAAPDISVQKLLDVFNASYSENNYKIGELGYRLRLVEFAVISKVNLQSYSQEFLNLWFDYWTEPIKSLISYLYILRTYSNISSFDFAKDTEIGQLLPSLYETANRTLFFVGQDNKTISLQILQEWFELDNLPVLRVPGDLERDIVDLKDAIDGASVVMFDDIDELLATLSDEQKEDLFDLLKSRREQGMAIMIFASSTSAESLSVYDFDRLGLHGAETLNLL